MRRFLVVMGAVLFVTPGAVARASVPIQPGMFIRTTTNGCTANFVFDGIGAEAGRVYLGTAAHCVGANGDAVLDEDGQAIGKVAAHGDGSIDADDHRDWALFEVPASQVARVDPSVVGHPQMPRGGLPDAAHVAAGDAVQFSGFGQLWVTPALQQGRTGTLLEFKEPHYSARGPIFFGDSGGPVVDLVSGRAVGVVSLTTVYGPPATVYETSGPTPGAVISQAAAAGVHVVLRTIEGGKGALPAPQVVTRTPVARQRPKISFTVDYLLGRRTILVGGHRFVVTAWLRGRKLELTLKRGDKSVSRAVRKVGSVRPDARLVIAVATRRAERPRHGAVRRQAPRVPRDRATHLVQALSACRGCASARCAGLRRRRRPGRACLR